MTRKIYYDDLYAQEFDAEILSLEKRDDGNFEVILNQTLFYPSGGGQPYDLGFINDEEVIEVFERGENIVHVLKNYSDDKDKTKVHGIIDWDRRFELMQQHLGQHIFSASLHNLHQLHTARMRIEGDNVSLDLDLHVEENIIREAEALANEIVWKNIPVEILYPEIEEVKKFARKLPPENSIPPIRIVKIEGVDYVPCCGLHVKSTGEVGLIKITSMENHKGGTRIYLKCGRPAYRWLDSLHHEIKKAETELVCGDSSIVEKIQILKNQIHDLKNNNEILIDHFLEPLAENLKNEAINDKIITHVMKNSGQDEVKHLFRLLTENDSDIIALIAGENPDGTFLTFGCNRENKKIDVRAAFKKAISSIEGKGGGSAFCAQGWGKKSEKIKNILDESKKLLIQK